MVLVGRPLIPLKFFEDLDCFIGVGDQDDGLLDLICGDVHKMFEDESKEIIHLCRSLYLTQLLLFTHYLYKK